MSFIRLIANSWFLTASPALCNTCGHTCAQPERPLSASHSIASALDASTTHEDWAIKTSTLPRNRSNSLVDHFKTSSLPRKKTVGDFAMGAAIAAHAAANGDTVQDGHAAVTVYVHCARLALLLLACCSLLPPPTHTHAPTRYRDCCVNILTMFFGFLSLSFSLVCALRV